MCVDTTNSIGDHVIIWKTFVGQKLAEYPENYVSRVFSFYFSQICFSESWCNLQMEPIVCPAHSMLLFFALHFKPLGGNAHFHRNFQCIVCWHCFTQFNQKFDTLLRSPMSTYCTNLVLRFTYCTLWKFCVCTTLLHRFPTWQQKTHEVIVVYILFLCTQCGFIPL